MTTALSSPYLRARPARCSPHQGPQTVACAPNGCIDHASTGGQSPKQAMSRRAGQRSLPGKTRTSMLWTLAEKSVANIQHRAIWQR
jgi:hypothetical protein